MARGRLFRNSVVWITGASSGIGRELAIGVSRRGARTVLSARRENALRETQNLCGGAERSRVVPADMEAIDDLSAVVNAVYEEFGRIDVAILNAGLSQRGTVADTEEEVVRRVNAVNFLAPAAIVRQLVRRMLSDGGGHIAAVSSLSTRVATPYRSAYTASKAALETYLTVLRRELYDAEVEVTLALPGFVNTEISRNALDPDGTAHGVVDKAQQHGMSPEVCAERILGGLERGKREILVPSDGRTRLGLFLAKWAPGILDRLISRAEVT